MEEDKDESKELLSDGSHKASGSESGPSSSSLPSEEEAVVPSVSLWRGYEMATPTERLILTVSVLSSLICGGLVQVAVILFCRVIAKMSPKYTIEDAVDEIRNTAWDIFWVAMSLLVAAYIWMWGFSIIGKRMADKFRVRYFKAVLHNSIPWFDIGENQEFTSKFTNETQLIEDGCGKKIGHFIFQITVFLAGVFVGFTRGLKLTLVTSSILPFMGLAAWVFGNAVAQSTKDSRRAYYRAGAVVEESLGSIKTVTATNSQERRLTLYQSHLETAKAANIKAVSAMGMGLGLMNLMSMILLGFTLYMGYLFITHNRHNIVFDRNYQIEDVCGVIISLFLGTMYLGLAAMLAKDLIATQQALYGVFHVIEESEALQDKDYEIDSEEKLGDVEGSFEFDNVDFRYPTRSDVPVFEGLTLSIPARKTTAFVGETGSGKSTIIQLIEKFYEPDNGKIYFGGKDLADLEPRLLRSKLALVSQEPVLFATTIFENIKTGNPQARPEHVIEAAKKANAHNFIMALPNQYETQVGLGGGHLSGGQKQRIAIARALVKNPLVLILDEATSALDNQSEKEVQEAISSISGELTQVVIAHRLTTIRNADQICVIKNHCVFERGTHDELHRQNGVYAGLLEYQLQEQQQREIDEKEIDELEADQGRKSTGAEKHTTLTLDPSSRSFIHYREQDTDTSAIQGIIEDEDRPSDFQRLYEINKPERKYLIAGGVFAALLGIAHPLAGIFFAQYIDAVHSFDDDSEDKDHLRKRIRWYCAVIFLIGVIQFAGNYFSQVFFGVAGEELTMRMRRRTLRSFFRMPMRFYDRPENTTGGLSAVLERDCGQMSGLMGSTLNFTIQAVFAILGGVILAAFWSWRMAIVILVLSPMFVSNGLINSGADKLFLLGKGEEDNTKELGGIVSESVTNIRVVRSFNAEDRVIGLYNEKLESGGQKNVHIIALIFGFAVCCPPLVHCICFFIGAKLAEEDIDDFTDILTAFFAAIYSGFGAGQAATLAPDTEKSRVSASNIFKIIDEESECDPFSDQGTRLNEHELKGNFAFERVYFKYPARDQVVLRKLNLTVDEGQSVALVGPSGCGKSTTIQLILRFYQPTSGVITLDGRPLNEYNLKDLRAQFGLVSQEPVLFNTTIEENIRYGRPDATDEEIREAAKQANALEFIENDGSNEGFKRKVGARGSKLSGGQKQRVAIARAIIKKPNILLLDEATSALDNQAERVVQEALDKIMLGKTTIVIAHKIATIQNCDKICVFKEGRVQEEGTHEQLLSRKGIYAELTKVK